MNIYSSHKQNNVSNSASPVLLYQVVYGTRLSLWVVFLLMVSFCLQPLRVDASEVVEDTSALPPQITDDLIDRIDDADPEPLPDTEIESALLSVTPSEEAREEEVTLPSATDSIASSTEMDGSSSGSSPYSIESETDTSSSTPSTNESGSSTTPVIPSEPIDTSQPPNDDTGTTTVPTDPTSPIPSGDLDVVAATSTPSATTTEPTATTSEIVLPYVTVESDQVVQFDKTDCVSVADGSYYCRERESVPATAADGLFSLPDATGDLEIFLQRDGKLRQLTNNQVDDASPQYDAMSDTMVWHRLVNDRYQIIVYDLASAEEFQLTDTASNNMEPFRSDKYIVWQHWSNNAWQIMLYDGEKIELLTDTTEHNIAPNIRNGLVVWHRVTGNNEQTIEVYDIMAGSYFTINDTDVGGEVSNPRMVLVFESTLPSGDVVTKGFDLVTGEVTTFSQTPTELPSKIPEPDATGEVRALIQNKQITEDDDVVDTDPIPGVPPPDTASSTTQNGSATPGLDLDLRSAEQVVSTTTIDVAIPDVVVRPFSEVATTTSAEIAGNDTATSTIE